MAKNPARVSKHNSFLTQPIVYIASALLLLVIGYILASLAIDSGSLLEWFGAIVAVIWGTTRFVKGIRRHFSSKAYGKR